MFSAMAQAKEVKAVAVVARHCSSDGGKGRIRVTSAVEGVGQNFDLDRSALVLADQDRARRWQAQAPAIADHRQLGRTPMFRWRQTQVGVVGECQCLATSALREIAFGQCLRASGDSSGQPRAVAAGRFLAEQFGITGPKKIERQSLETDDLCFEVGLHYKNHRQEMNAGVELLWPGGEDLYGPMCLRSTIGAAAFASGKQGDPFDPAACEFPPEYFGGPGFWFEQCLPPSGAD
jgi:hypothetical protein